jgi:hypothetical protein
MELSRHALLFAGRLFGSALPLLASSTLASAQAADPGSVETAPQIGPGWEMIYGDRAGRTFLDRRRSARRGDFAPVRLFSINYEEDAEGVMATLAVVEMDCRTGAGTTLERHRYRFDGTQIDGGIVPDARRERRVPVAGPPDARIAARLCGRATSTGSQSADERVMVRFRHPTAICAGVCPDFVMWVSPRGRIVTRNIHWTGTYRFRATPAQLEAFHEILGSIRPTGERRLDTTCARAPDDPPADFFDPRPDDIEIRWIGPHTAAHLTFCPFGRPELRETIVRALRALGSDQVGEPANPDGTSRVPVPRNEHLRHGVRL